MCNIYIYAIYICGKGYIRGKREGERERVGCGRKFLLGQVLTTNKTQFVAKQSRGKQTEQGTERDKDGVTRKLKGKTQNAVCPAVPNRHDE